MIPKMDYVVVTYNDQDTIINTIDSIRKQENVNRLIIVASERCTDNTLKMLRELMVTGYGPDILLTENVGLAYARRLAIDMVETKWFVFVDADVVLSDTWIKEMWDSLQYCDEFKLGGLVGYLYRNEEQRKDLINHSELRVITDRMFTHNTILRYECVSDWCPLRRINSYEDYLITQHIIKKGYVCFNVQVLSFHDHRGSAWREATWGGAGAKATGFYKNILAPLSAMIYGIGGGFKRTFRQRKLSFLKISIIKGVGTLWGYLRSNKYIKK